MKLALMAADVLLSPKLEPMTLQPQMTQQPAQIRNSRIGVSANLLHGCEYVILHKVQEPHLATTSRAIVACGDEATREGHGLAR
jgi:hypothetical protein